MAVILQCDENYHQSQMTGTRQSIGNSTAKARYWQA